MTSRVAAAMLALAALTTTASACESQSSAPLFSLRGNLRGVAPAGAITIVGFDKSRSGTVTLVAWLTREGSICYGGVAADVPQGQYDRSGPVGGVTGPGSPRVFGKPIFWPGPALMPRSASLEVSPRSG